MLCSDDLDTILDRNHLYKHFKCIYFIDPSQIHGEMSGLSGKNLSERQILHGKVKLGISSSSQLASSSSEFPVPSKSSHRLIC